ncbi:IspD/TarI family cytidylyltransferase [Helcococcus bovis]|uniref:IspD/TarI family cytidylyltransferase n=1 Tax=Helcococcus bovis TaxID=3153252 RepID=UPI0038BD61C6
MSKNIAIIIAGGSGSRMGQDIPKQFINVYDKPILIYTLESFERHPLIDAIEVVCIDGWEQVLQSYAKQFNITKLKWIVKGGSTGQESIRNGVYNLENHVNADDNIIIHDGIRPLVDDAVLSDVISKCDKYGNSVTSMPYNEQIFVIDDEISTVKYIPRETLKRVSTPQAYKFDLLFDKYHEAFEKEIGIYGSHYVNTMMVELGVRLYFAAGSDKNIKLTTKDDLEMFKAHLKADKNNWLK